MTKQRTVQLLRDVDQQGAAIRFCIAAFRAMGLIETRQEKGHDEPMSFVDPAWAGRLQVLQRGFGGRLKWLLTGK